MKMNTKLFEKCTLTLTRNLFNSTGLTLSSLPPLHTVSVRARSCGFNALEVVAMNTLFSTGSETILTRVLTSGSSPIATANRSVDWALISMAASTAASGAENFPAVIRTTV